MTVALRVAGIGALPGLLGLVHAAYREPGAGGWTTEAGLLGGQRTDAAALRELLVSVRDVVLVAGGPRTPLACCTVGRHDGAVRLGLFAVRPAEQGSGVGREVLRAAEEHARARWRPGSIRLDVIAQREDLVAWYERRGYARTGETSPFPYGDERFGLPRRDDLRFVALRRELP